MNAFISKKQQLKDDLHHSRSRISISFDLWTSPNSYAILGVVAMWIDATGKRRTTVLGMRRVDWLSRYDSQRDLASFALDLFAISPMSDECERPFSSAKLTIVDCRGRLKADIIEACECLRAWYGKPHVEDDSDSEDNENDNDRINE